MEYDFRKTVLIEGAVDLVKKNRARIYLHCDVPLPVDENHYYPKFSSIRVTRRAALEFLEDARATSEYRVKSGRGPLHITVEKSGNILWLGGSTHFEK